MSENCEPGILDAADRALAIAMHATRDVSFWGSYIFWALVWWIILSMSFILFGKIEQ